MKHFYKIQWVACVLILILGIVGCEMLGPDSTVGPTAPVDVSPNPAHLANLWVGRGQNKVELTPHDTGGFTVNVLAGSYLLMYWTDSGPFYIVFKAATPTVLVIGLQPADNVYHVTLEQGTITVSDDQALVVQGDVLIFAWPANPEVGWDSVIIDLTSFTVLLQNGGIPGAEGAKCTITTQVVGSGTIKPAGPITKPCGSSHSFKFKPGPPELTDVTIDGESVIGSVQILGNGDGHLVIHDIQGDILLTGVWGG